jgi:HK97 family phage prohead protease
VGDEFRIQGHAAVFDRHSQDLGGFVERVAPGAFKKTIREADVRALFNHDPNMILGRSTAGTLRLSEDRAGLAYDLSLPDNTLGRDLRVSIERGDITQSSFGFRTIHDSWSRTDDGYPLRTLEEVSLHNGDVSPVTYPAYEDTDVTARAAVRNLSQQTGVPADELVEAIREGRADYMTIVNIGTAVPGHDHPVRDEADMLDDPDSEDAFAQPKPGAPIFPLSLKSAQLELQRRKFSPAG